MKWLKIIGIITGVLIVILISVTIVVNHKATDTGERGHSEGHALGYKAGYEVGREEGQAQGYEVGYEAGHKEGYKVGDEEGYNSGYETGFEEAVGTDYLVRNPTYSEVQEILAEDKTHSAWQINNNAEDKGIRTAYVAVFIPGESHIPIVAFETLDKGLILIDPWKHQEVKVEVGKRYSELNGFAVPDYDDTIIRIRIIW